MLLTILFIALCFVAAIVLVALFAGVRQPSIENLLNNIEDENRN